MVTGNFWRSFGAVLIGNAVYYSVMRFLPSAAQHTPGRLDLGLAVDFWICLLVMGLLELWHRRRHKASSPP
jgi:hypothetical protein